MATTGCGMRRRFAARHCRYGPAVTYVTAEPAGIPAPTQACHNRSRRPPSYSTTPHPRTTTSQAADTTSDHDGEGVGSGCRLRSYAGTIPLLPRAAGDGHPMLRSRGARSLHPIGTQAKVEGSLRREPLGGGYRSSTVAQVLATPSLNPQLTRGDLITGP